MKRTTTIAAAAAAILIFGLAFTSVQAQDRHDNRSRIKINLKQDMDRLERSIDEVLGKLELLSGLRVRVHGPKEFRLDVDIQGLGATLRDLERWGERCDREKHRRLTREERRELRRALAKLEDLDIDLDIDFDKK
ncbi:MAG: hypothetical protein PHI34_13915 [Acidobacteriota bacterium]|nr:hypothetical protein [Acidobacteriota bacterium]